MINSTVLCALILLLSALMLHYFMVIEENFQTQRTVSRRPVAKPRPRRVAPTPPPAPVPVPIPVPAAEPEAAPVTPQAAPVAPQAAPVAPQAAPVAPQAAPVAPQAAPVAPQEPAADLAKVDQTTAPAKAPAQPSMSFSELINSLLSYKPIQTAQEQINVQPLSSKSSLDGTAVQNIDVAPIQDLSVDVKRIRMGVKDIQNILKSERSSQPIVPSTPAANSNGLQQGNWFRSNTDGACPYALGQQELDNPVRPADDMSDYIRKDSIPCWGCSLK